MHITNKYNLIEPLYRALIGRGFGVETKFTVNYGNLSVSKLNMPIRQALLMSRHDSDLEEDASERIWMLLGLALHYVLEQGYTPGVIKEVPVSFKMAGWQINGRLDLWWKRILMDWKITSVWQVVFGTSEQYEEQLNVYDYALSILGIPVDELRTELLLRDWAKSKAAYDKGYPQIPFHEFRAVKKWSRMSQIEYIDWRVKLFDQFYKVPDSSLPYCSTEEIWAKPDQWALMKGKNKRATKLYGNRDEAHERAKVLNREPKNKDSYTIVLRPGEWSRCKDYCAVSGICLQYLNYIKG